MNGTGKIANHQRNFRGLGISSRMLRYFEQLGLVKACVYRGMPTRVYDETAVRRLRQIIILPSCVFL